MGLTFAREFIMVAGMSVFSLFFALLSGGANDLLDFVASDAYWQAKGQTVTVDQLIGELKPPAAADVSQLIKTLGSGSYQEREDASKKIMAIGVAAIPALEKAVDNPDAEVANRARGMVQQLRLNSKANGVRQLMAIRTLGEMKKAEGLPALKALLESKEMFVADYAARAIAQIEGKPLPARAFTRDSVKGDLSLLPANCGIIGQSIMASDKVAMFNDVLKSLPPQPGEDRKALIEGMTKEVIQVADQIGNVRLEAMTFGVADTVGPQDGFATAIAHGQYDSAAVIKYVHSQMPNPTENIEGYEVFSPADTVAFVFVSDNRALAITGATKAKLPVKEILAATHAKPNPAGHPLLSAPEFAPFAAKLNDKSRAWVICKVSDSYRQAPVIQPFDTLTLLTTQEKDGVSISLNGAGKDAAAVKGAVNQVNVGIAQAKNELPKMMEQIPMLKPVNDFVQAVKCEADGKNASLTGTYQGDPAMLIAMPFMMMTGEAAPRAVQPPIAPPAQVQEKAAPDAPAKEAEKK